MRPLPLAVTALLAAVLGGAAALGIGHAAGWVGRVETVVLRQRDSSAATVATTARDPALPLAGNEFDPVALYRARVGGVVTIHAVLPGHATSGAPVSQGSGFVVDERGTILTNSHVITTVGEQEPGQPVEPATDVYVEFSDGGRVPARIVGWDLFSDVGVVRVDPADHEVSPVPLGDSSRVQVGEPVAVIGSPFAQTSSLSVGVVSATGRSIDSLTSAYTVADAIQIDAPINRGNSGGPLFNAAGEVIGINAQIRSDSGFAEGVGFAIPINTAARALEQIEKTGRVRYAWLGVQQLSLTPTMSQELGYEVERGALIECVVPGSPADEAGLRGGKRRVWVAGQEVAAGGDVVIAIEGQPVRSSVDLSRIVSTELFPGRPAVLTIVRDGDRIDLTVEPRDRNQDTKSCDG